MLIKGRVAEVITRDAVGSLEVDATIGENVLYLNSVYVFNDDGGELVIDGDGAPRRYSGRNVESGALYLSDVLSGSFETGTRVYASPLSPFTIAYVRPEANPEEAIEAIVKVPDVPYLPDGVRLEESMEYVEVENVGGDFEVVRILNEVSAIQVSSIVGLSEFVSGSDGLPPGNVQGVNAASVIKGVIVGWAPLTNPDFVSYRLYGSTNPNFPADDNTRITETSSTQHFVRQVWNPVAMVREDVIPGTVYYFKVTGVDEDGEGSVDGAVVVSGTPTVIERSDIGPGTIGPVEIADLSILVKKMNTQQHQIY